MHLPVGPARRASLDRFRLRRGLGAEDLAGYAAARLAALEAAAATGSAGPRSAPGDDAEPGLGPAWRPLGPFAVPHGHTAGSGPGSRPVVTGRVAAVAVDPRNPRHLLAGGGGVWESGDGGGSWACRTDDMPSAAIGALAFAPGDPAVVYAGTGQGEVLAALGVGLLRSADGGTTWRPLVAEELLGAGCDALLVDPGDPGRLLAATTTGLWASADGGRSWEPRLPGRSWAVSPGPDGEVLAGGELGLHRSADGGATWSAVPLEAAPDGLERVAVAHAPGGGVAYVFAAGDGVGHLWRREHPDGPFDPVKPPADLNSRQAWHHWALAADPASPDVVWLGAAGLHRGALGGDGRWAWTDLTARPAGHSLPLGQHAVVAGPGDRPALYVAGEGGLFGSPDGGRSWRSLGTGLAVAEVDRLADHAAWLLAGAGELGTLRYEGSEVWCPLGPGEPAVVDGDQLVAGVDGGLVVSADGGSSWSAASLPEAQGEVTALATLGPGRLLAGTSEGELLRLDRASGGWVAVGAARPRDGRVAGVAADPGRPGVVWAAWSSRRGAPVWRSEDGGASWTEAGHGLPGVPAGAVVPDPDRPGTVYAATDAGVWWSGDDGNGWRPLGRRLPATPALALALRRDGRVLRAGLLGRGVWELPLDGRPAPATPALRSNRSPAPLPRPGGPWWECPDIRVGVPPRPGEGPLTPVEFEDDRWPWSSGPRERGGRVVPGRPARVHVQVHHRGDGPLHGVRVRVLAAPACLRPPDLPTGPWPTEGDAPPPGSPWRSIGPPVLVGDLAPGRSAVATFDWDVPTDLPRDLCFLAVATAGPVEGLWTASDAPSPAGLPSRAGAPESGGAGSGVPGAVDPADLVTRDPRWGCKSLTVLYPGAAGRVVRLELLGGVGRGPFALAAEGWVAGVTAGLVLPRRLGRLAVEGGLVAGRVAEAWRPELVALVREEPELAGRLDLATALAPPGAADPSPGAEAGLERWLQGMDLDPRRPEPVLLLLRTPPPSGRGCLLLLDADGGVLGGHTIRVAG